MSKRRAYRATPVKKVDGEKLLSGKDKQTLHVGLDVGKYDLLSVLRWQGGQFERPWRVKNPEEIGALVELLLCCQQDHDVTVALESTGTYGDGLRQALSDACLSVHRVSTKATHDYAEIFDGVPSNHDGKDAAMIAELAALGKSSPWPYQLPSLADQEMTYWVDWMDAHRRQWAMWQGRLEGLLARHWPEITRLLRLTSLTLLRALEHYGGPGPLSQDPQAGVHLRTWTGARLRTEKLEQVIACAQTTWGVRQGEFDFHRMQQFARQTLAAHQEVQKSKEHLARLVANNDVIQTQAKAVGLATASVLWVHLGDPSAYSCAAAYRKAMGLNLTERSSGTFQGKLKISKRGSARVRRWLFFAALRWVRQGPIRVWYERKKSRDGGKAMRGLIGVMRKLALALYHVGVEGQVFEAQRLFAEN